jgi:hypothetical protein
MGQQADLKRYALSLLDLSKQFLLEDGDLDPVAFIITADDQLLRPLDLEDEGAKLESCKKIVDEARRRKALAIVTVFLARSKDFEKGDFVQEAYSWGEIQDADSERCILVTLSGPGIKNWAVALPFGRDNGKIAFRKQAEFTDGVDLGFFPGWSEVTSPRAS